jgi:hypothetical protein
MFLEKFSKKDLDNIAKYISKDSEQIQINEDPSVILAEHKEFSNWNIKYEMLRRSKDLLESFGKKSDTLFDISSGRGNDLNRWIQLRFNRVIGLEYDQQQLKIAIERYKKKSKQIKVTYIQGSAINYSDVREAVQYKKVPLISNNYAMNYFLETKETFETFLKSVSDSLEDDGLFIGTATDGDMLEFLFDKFGPEIKNKVYYAKLLSNDAKLLSNDAKLFPSEDKKLPSDSKEFGIRYQFKLDLPFFQNTGDSEEAAVIEEFILSKKTLIKTAAKFGLIPYSLGPNMKPIFNLTEFPLIVNKTKNELYNRPISISSLYFGFSFIKISPVISAVIKNKGFTVISKNKDHVDLKKYQKIFPINPIMFGTEVPFIFDKRSMSDVELGPDIENIHFISITNELLNRISLDASDEKKFDKIFDFIIKNKIPYFVLKK